jgi:nucleoside transporter
VLPTIIFFSSFISVLYYLGIIQAIIMDIAWVMSVTMGTTASESVNAAGNIFVGQTEAPLMIRPFLKTMTSSEIHAVMTGGFSTIAGGVLAAYVSFGVSASALISASVMSAPAALAISKLLYPECEESPTKNVKNIKIDAGTEQSVVEAAATGASQAVGLVGNVAAMLIAFLSLVAVLDALLGWLGGMVNVPSLSFELICSYILVPAAWLMGIDPEDCQKVAAMLGQKTFINEFVAYLTLGSYIGNKVSGEGPTISLRSEVIATYALCGFANIGSIGIQLGGLIPLAPSRAADISALGVRAMIAGTVACFMTACVAGILFDESRILAEQMK